MNNLIRNKNTWIGLAVVTLAVGLSLLSFGLIGAALLTAGFVLANPQVFK